MNNIFIWILHIFIDCPESSLDHTMYGTTHCRECGRVHFISDNLPKMKHPVVNIRNL